MNDFSRRRFFQLAGTIGAVASEGFRLNAQQPYPPPVPLAPIFPYTSRSPVSLVKGDVRRKNVLDALVAVDKEIRPAMARKKYVLIKINNVSTTNQLAATHVDAIRGILDYVAPRFKGPVVIAEASSRDTMEGFENYKYAQVIPEFKAQRIKLVDLNREKKFEVFAIVDRDIRPTPVRLAAQLMDPDAFVISAAMLKTHNAVVATGSVKNMVLGAPLHSLAGETEVFADKHLYHAMPAVNPRIGVNDCHHAMIYNMAITALHMPEAVKEFSYAGGTACATTTSPASSETSPASSEVGQAVPPASPACGRFFHGFLKLQRRRDQQQPRRLGPQ
jgi:hypothetical protein